MQFSSYSKLFSIGFNHDFYTEGRYGRLEMMPLPVTSKLMESYGMGLRFEKGLFYVYFKESDTHPHLLRSSKQPVVLSFALRPTDPNFILFTKLSTLSLGEVYNFCNLENPVGDNSQFLTGTDQLSDENVVKFYSPGAGFEKFTNDCVANPIAKDPFGNELFSGDKKGFVSAVRQLELFDYTDWVLVDHEDEAVRVCPFSIPTGTVGIVSIVINPADESASFSSLIEKEFKISFESRSIFWRYNIIPRRKSDLRDLEIVNGKESDLFGEVEEVVLSNGKTAHLLESISPIKLQEQYESGYRLELKKFDARLADEGAQMRYKLPTPSVDKVRMIKENNSVKSYSDIYFYI